MEKLEEEMISKEEVYKALGFLTPAEFKQKSLIYDLERFFEKLPDIIEGNVSQVVLKEFGKRQNGKTTNIMVQAYILAHNDFDVIIRSDSYSFASRKQDVFLGYEEILNEHFGAPSGDIYFLNRDDYIKPQDRSKRQIIELEDFDTY